ncbi:putative quinol monooxygenase [Devosia sp. Leaf64]|jgi:quinol monooxygenase YgiN|uniref:putative quinol monooxygenase n=1 Tax=Devosia sp. Leaf64 TaxID=1736229 RepID=UPI000713E881|nr:putative quinol monooxygenase [Devosia sp. Leaf64]KQN75113.1 antibiotic biosynthesis monooxygenase [Devosia sp. Leaf64]
MDILNKLPANEPVSLIAEFTARVGKAEEVAELLAGLATDVRAEPGNVVFDTYRRFDARQKFVVYEIYKDRAAFEAHISAEYGAVFNAKLRTLIEEPNSVLTFLSAV